MADWDEEYGMMQRGGNSPARRLPTHSGEVQRLQAEINSLHTQCEESERRAQEYKMQLMAAKRANKATLVAPSEEKPNSKFAANANPLIRPTTGLIDGRSNSEAAFKQKCDLLREFKAEFGSCRIPVKPPAKYYKLVDFVMKQRSNYRRWKEEGSHEERQKKRVEILEEIGIEWTRKIEDNWQENFDKLKAFKEEHGHCCLAAVPSYADDGGLLAKWVMAQRNNLRKYRLTQSHDSNENVDDGSEKKPAPVESKQADGTGGDELDQDGELAPKKDRGIVKGRPSNFTDEKCELLLSLNCNFLNSFEHSPKAKTIKFVMNNVRWYKILHEFRKYFAKHGNGLVETAGKSSSYGLPRWVLEQRRAYYQVKEGKVESCPEYEVNFELLKASGFVYDKDVIQQENERIAKIKAEEATKETSASKLEVAKKGVEKALQDQEVAKTKVKEAQKVLSQAKMAVKAAQSLVKKAELVVKMDPVGKKVLLKPRGKDHPGGPAIVLAVRTLVIVGSEESFYDLKMVDSNAILRNVDGQFVAEIDQGFRLLAAAVAEAERIHVDPVAVIRRSARDGKGKKRARDT